MVNLSGTNNIDDIIEERIILKGRGGGSNKNPGNSDYRSLIQSLKPDYKQSEKNGKSIITSTINNTIIDNGYNLAEENGDLIEKPILYDELRKKTSQALRENAVFKEQANNPELVQEMVGQIKEKLKGYDNRIFNGKIGTDDLSKKQSSFTESGTSGEKTWVNKVVPKYPEKRPRDNFINIVRNISSPATFTEEDFEKEIKDEILNGGGFASHEKRWQNHVQDQGGKVFDQKSFSK